MKYQETGKINFNKKLCHDIFHMSISLPQIALSALPGQFINIRVDASESPLLRRPMSIFNIERENLEIVYRLRGEGTQKLSEKTRGDKLDVLGPLGNGFTIEKKDNVILIGGGMGLVPLYYLAKVLLKNKIKFKIFMGARTCAEITTLKFFKNLKIPTSAVLIATDDGSEGFKGNVIQLLDNHLKSDNNGSQIYSCGPPQMLKALQKTSEKYNVPAQVSLEEYMGCGVGACLSCVCKTKENQYARVCTEGPVFNSNEVII